MKLGKVVNWMSESKEPLIAIYAIWENEQVVYIGSTSSPYERLNSHRLSERFSSREIFMEVLVWVCEGERFSSEREIIRLGLKQDLPLENEIWKKQLF